MQQIAYTIGNKLYLNITDRCTLRCRFCPKTKGDLLVKGYDLTLRVRPEAEEIIAAIGDPADYEQIVFCGYGEPTLRLKVLKQVAEWIKAHGGRSVRINTDGLANRVNKRNVLPELEHCIDALSVSMNAQNAELYDQHCDPSLPHSFEEMLDFLSLAPFYIKDVTATAIEGLEGVDIVACRQLAEERGVAFRKRILDEVG